MDYNFSNILQQFCEYDNYLNLFLKIPKYFPKHKSIYYFFLLFKLLPLIVVTHDWNISSKLGVSFWIRKFTLAEYIADVHHIFIYYFFTIGLFILVIIVIFLFIYLKSKTKYNGKLFHKHKSQLYFVSLVIFYIFYALSQFYFSIFVENVCNHYSKKQNKFLYYLIIILQGIVIIFTFMISFLMGSIVIHEPFFINSLSPLLNEIGSVDLLPIFLIINQIVVQLEFSLEFKNIFLVKAVTRGLYCLYYINSLFNYNNYFYKFYFYYILKFTQSCCFASCIIEFFFCYDYSNELKILQKDSAIISIKLIFEIICGILLNEIYFYIDNQKIREQVKNFSYKNIKTFNNKMIKFLNMLYYQQRPYLLKVILQELNYSISLRVHNPPCKEKKGEEKCYYCHVYSSQNFTLQMNIFINFIQSKNDLDYNCIKNNFPLLFYFFESEINHYKEINFSNKNTISSLFFVVTYIYVYERNYYKCLFILEKILSNSYIQKSLLSIYQITFFKHKLIQFYKNELYNICGKIRQITITENIQKHQKKIEKSCWNFKCIERIFYIETIYKQFLVDYIKMLTNFNDDIILFCRYDLIINKFIQSYESAIDITNKLFSSSKCIFFYPIYKLYMFFIYFRKNIPTNIKQSFDSFFDDGVSSLIDTKTNFYTLVLKVQFLINETSFKINYASDNLIEKLRYTNQEFNALNFNEIYAKTFYKSYKYFFEKNLSDGIDFFKLNNLCLIDKNKYVILFDLEGVSIFKKNGIRIYLKLTESKETLLINKNKNNEINRKKINKKKSNFCGSSFLFTKKSGKIFNLSRGFEDLFFLNTRVLDKYNINILELLKIDKLDSKGIIMKSLSEIYENIYDIYLREVGQLGEDPFSQVILLLNEFRNNIKFTNNHLYVKILYEEKRLIKEGKKIKYYYLFILTIFVEEKKENYQTNEIIQLFQQQTSTINQSENSDLHLNSVLYNNVSYFNQNKNQFFLFLSKLHNIKNLSKIILNKYFKIKSKNINIELDNLNQRNGEEIHNENCNLLKQKDKEKKEKNKAKQYFFIKYFPGIISFFFIIIYSILYYEKIRRIISIKKYFQGTNNELMLAHSSIQIVIKTIELLLKNNNLQPDIINESYNNSFDYHIDTLSKRNTDYLSFKIQFLEFFNPLYSTFKQELFLLIPQNYCIPDINGLKKFEMTESIMNYLNIIVINIYYNMPLQIILNNSEYYFNDSMINNSSIDKSNYYNFAKNYILIVDDFSKFFSFYYNELLNIIMIIVFNKIDSQFTVSIYNSITSGIFVFSVFFFFFFFLLKTNKIYKKTFISHTTLRFFNNYLIRKTCILLDYFDNFSEVNYYKQILNNLEIIEDNQEIILSKQILSDLIYDFNIIRI